MIIRHRAGYDGTHTNHCESTDRKVATNYTAGTDGRPGPNQSGQSRIVRGRRAKCLQIRRRSARVAVIRKNNTCTDHHSILDGHCCANVNKGIDLYLIAYSHSIGDIGLLANDALVSDLSAVPDVNIVPN